MGGIADSQDRPAPPAPGRKHSRPTWAWLAIILVFALALRLTLLWPMIACSTGKPLDRAITPDSEDYMELAMDLGVMTAVRGAGAFEDPRARGMRPEITRTPGYPGFLAACNIAPPNAPRQLRGLWLALELQVLMDTILVMVTYALAKELAPQAEGTSSRAHGQGTSDACDRRAQRVALVAGGLQAISLLAIASCCRVLSDSLFAFLLTASVLLMVRHFRTSAWRALLGSALLLGAACYVRPVGLVMAGVFVVVLLSRAKRLRRAGAFAGVVAACVAPWVIRNAVVADYVGFSSFAGESMYGFSAPLVVSRVRGITPQEALELLVDEEGAIPSHDRYDKDGTLTSSTPTAGALARHRSARALEIIAEHPWLYLDIHLKGCAAVMLPEASEWLEVAGYTTGERGTLDVLHRDGLWAAAKHYFGDNRPAMVIAGIITLIWAGRLFGVLVAAIRSFRPPKGRAWRPWPRISAGAWLMVLLTAMAILLPGPAGHPRFRVPVEPFLSIAAAAGWLAVVGWWTERRRRRGHLNAENAESAETE